MRLQHGLRTAVLARNDLDLAAAFPREGQELFDRQRIRDPFGEPLGARGGRGCAFSRWFDGGEMPRLPRGRSG